MTTDMTGTMTTDTTETMTTDKPRTWLVTGSSRGLGREIVLAALKQGDRVVATARRPEQLDDLAADFPGRLLAVRLDVTDAAAAAAVQTAVTEFGSLDVLVNNAGYADLASVEDSTLDAFRAQIDTNLFGVVHVTKAALPVLREQGGGHIITVSSVGGRVATPGLSAYQSAKWAVNGFTEVLASEVAPLGIKVTTIEPGGMRTDWAGSSMTVPATSEPYAGTVGLVAAAMAGAGENALGDPAKVARVVTRLVDLPEPPPRLVLGSEALAYARAAARTLADRDAAWAELSRSTDRDDATDQQRDPLGQSANDPETVVRRFLDEVVNGGDLSKVDDLWAEDLRWHGGSLGDVRGLAAFKNMMATSAADAFTGMHLDVQDVITSGDKVVVRFTNSGTHTGPFMGTPATGRHAEWLGIGIYAVAGGRIAEAWFGEDVLGMLLQLEAVTLPAAA
ncbi:SDR family NAD(P)-dependent oxidoreductase [Streptomyces sp. NPDC001928]|uniref:SDR family NAD(P)-dependent oxidoreductase n=1 Tax=Streptomyces sp. NPDC001928 TaxID=3154404 RepID=UPI003326BA75